LTELGHLEMGESMQLSVVVGRGSEFSELRNGETHNLGKRPLDAFGGTGS